MNADIQRAVLVDVNRDCPIRDINNLLVTIICSLLSSKYTHTRSYPNQ